MSADPVRLWPRRPPCKGHRPLESVSTRIRPPASSPRRLRSGTFPMLKICMGGRCLDTCETSCVHRRVPTGRPAAQACRKFSHPIVRPESSRRRRTESSWAVCYFYRVVMGAMSFSFTHRPQPGLTCIYSLGSARSFALSGTQGSTARSPIAVCARSKWATISLHTRCMMVTASRWPPAATSLGAAVLPAA